VRRQARHQYRRRYRYYHKVVLRPDDHDYDQLAREWDRNMIPELHRNAQRIEIVLAGKPSAATLWRMWECQRDDFRLFVNGTADPDLFESRKRDLDMCEARMAALIEEIEAHNAKVRAKVN
jgi:hypothetical protein